MKVVFFLLIFAIAPFATAQENEPANPSLGIPIGTPYGTMAPGTGMQTPSQMGMQVPPPGGYTQEMLDVRAVRMAGDYFKNRIYEEQFLTRLQKDFRIKGKPIQIDVTMACDEALKTKDSRLSAMQTAEDVENSVRCSKDFDEKDWSKDTPDLLDGGKISLSQAKAYLLRFAKPGGYDHDRHAHIFASLLTNKVVRETYKKEILLAAQGIVTSTDKSVYLGSLNIPLMTPMPDDTEGCRSESELKFLRKKSYEIAVRETSGSDMSRMRTISGWGRVVFLIPSLKNLSSDQKADIKKPIYRTLANGAVARYDGLNPSKARLFTKSYVNKLFGDPTKEFSEFTGKARSDGSERYYLMGTTSFSSGNIASDRDEYGIEQIRTAALPANVSKGSTIERHMQWDFEGKKYSATSRTTEKDAGIYLATGSQPDYDKMWEDKKLSGLVLVSDNLDEYKPRTTENYVQYYAEKGFDFSKPTDIGDSKAWIEKNMSDGTVDYVLKDAHTGGNTSYLMTISKSHKLLKGVKDLGNGKKEEVYILAPGSEEYGPSQKLEYTDVKKWMDQREKDKKGPVVYVNSSCWSFSHAGDEVASIESPLFVNVASETTTTTFVSNPNSTKYQLVEGIREGKSYKEIRKDMQSVSRYSEELNQFRFPDEKIYIDNLKKLRSMEIKIKDESGKEYLLEEAAH